VVATRNAPSPIAILIADITAGSCGQPSNQQTNDSQWQQRTVLADCLVFAISVHSSNARHRIVMRQLDAGRLPRISVDAKESHFAIAFMADPAPRASCRTPSQHRTAVSCLLHFRHDATRKVIYAVLVGSRKMRY